MVPNESDIAAFKDYTPSADDAAPAAAAPAADTTAAAAQPAPATAAPAATYPEHSLGMHSTHARSLGHIHRSAEHLPPEPGLASCLGEVIQER